MMSGSTRPTEQVPICDAECLSTGGFAADTEIITTDGPQLVTDLKPGVEVLALNPTAKVVKPKRLVDVETFDSPFKNIHIQTRRSDLLVAPDHRIPYTTRSIDRPRVTRARALTDREAYNFLNEWRPRSGPGLAQMDLTDYCCEYEINAEFDVHGHRVQSILPDGCDPCRQNAHTGYFFDPSTFDRYQNEIEALADRVAIHAGPNHWRRPYRFAGDDFIEFIGWFVTEGSVNWDPDSDTATIGLAQKDPQHRETIGALLDRMGLPVNRTANGFSFSSKLFGRFLERLCGPDAATKRLPEFVWDCTVTQKRLLLDTLIDGDGNEWGTFYTSSQDLAGDVLRLMLDLGMKPRYNDGSIWEIHLSTINDGFKSSRNVSESFVDGPMYRLAVEDFSIVMAGQNGKFQWAGVSAVV